jgi:hypothetical protein
MKIDLMTQNRLNQIAFSVLVQLSKQDDIEPYMTQEARKMREVLSKIPDYLVRNNVFIVPDRPETAIATQKIDVDRIIEFMASRDGGGKFLPALTHRKAPVDEKTKLTSLNEKPNDDPELAIQKKEISSRLEYYLKTVFNRAKLVDQAKKYYDSAKTAFESLPDRGLADVTVPVAKYQKAYAAVLHEAELLAGKLDAFALAYLFYMRNRGEVISSGFSTKPYDKALQKLEEESLPEFGMAFVEAKVPSETPKPMG